MGDVKTAFLRGDMGESEGQIYGDPPPDARRLLGLSRDDLLKLEGSVYGFRTAPKVWGAMVAKDMQELGFVRHPLDQTVFVLYALDKGSKPDAQAASVAS
eukprot:989051-Lingulodinium_polyedra.AAC.1